MMRLLPGIVITIIAALTMALFAWLGEKHVRAAETWCLTLDGREFVATGRPRTQHGYRWRWTDSIGRDHRYHTVNRGASYVRECEEPGGRIGS